MVSQVATNCNISAYLVNGVTAVMSRSRHIMRDNVVSFQVGFPNWGVPDFSPEQGSGSTFIFSVGILYNGVATRVTWSGSNTVSVADGLQSPLSDPIAITIPKGDAFFVQTYVSSTANVWLNANYLAGAASVRDDANGEECQFGSFVVDQSLVTGTITSNTGAIYRPNLIVATTSVPSFALYGDSRLQGFADVYIGTSSDHGCLCRFVGPLNGYINCGKASERATDFVASHTLRVALAAYATNVIVEYGINDIIGGRSDTDVETDLQTIYGYFPGKDIRQSTQEDFSDSTDSWATLGNQTANAHNGTLNLLKTAIRAGLSGMNGYLELANVMQNTPTDGLWVVNGTANYYTADGAHENTTACLALQAAMMPSAPTIGTAIDVGGGVVSVSFTPANETGKYPDTLFMATSSLGGASATGVSSPILVPVAGTGVPQTFSVMALSILGLSPPSGNSNSVTPFGSYIIPKGIGQRYLGYFYK